MTELTQDLLNQLLDYDPDTGVFRWKVARGRGVKAGDVAGSLRPDGYLQITLLWNRYLAHRLAWFYMKAEYPRHQIDHINRIRNDNRLTNLRTHTPQENQRNRSLSKNNKSGVNGVRWRYGKQKWCADIKINRKPIHLGYFNDLQEAARVRKEAELKYGFAPTHGQKDAMEYE